jgi:hypothetical protein
MVVRIAETEQLDPQIGQPDPPQLFAHLRVHEWAPGRDDSRRQTSGTYRGNQPEQIRPEERLASNQHRQPTFTWLDTGKAPLEVVGK